MAPITNAKLIFNEAPTEYPEPGKTTVYSTSDTIDIENLALNGGILLKTLYLSIDPYMRSAMRGRWPLGKTISGLGIAVVIRSEHDGFKKGDHVHGGIEFAQYTHVQAPEIPHRQLLVLKNEEGIKWSSYIGVAGMPGKTAYYGWKEYAIAKAGETVFITTAAGAVGSLVIQLAKLAGLKVIASAGSDDKVEFMKELGADVAFNYKKQDTKEVLKKEGPIQIYWDHVGGEQLDAALDAADNNARFIECGMISHYNNDKGVTLKNFTQIIYKQTTIQGLFVQPLDAKYASEFYQTIPKMVQEGKLKFKEEFYYGLDKGGDAMRDQQMGKNFGKIVLVVSEEEN